jgi:hypothetical protein
MPGPQGEPGNVQAGRRGTGREWEACMNLVAPSLRKVQGDRDAVGKAVQATRRARSSIVSARSPAIARSFDVGSRPNGTSMAT